MTKEVQMLKKLKLMFVTSALLIGGVAGIAAAHGDKADRPDRAAMKEKFAAKKAEMLATFDSNRNGTLDPAEKDAMHTARMQKKFASLDANKDGVLTLAEFKEGKRGGDKRHGRKGQGNHRSMGRGQP